MLKITGSQFNSNYEITITNDQLVEGKLRKNSYIDCGFVATIDKELVTKKIGKVNSTTLEMALEAV